MNVSLSGVFLLSSFENKRSLSLSRIVSPRLDLSKKYCLTFKYNFIKLFKQTLSYFAVTRGNDLPLWQHNTGPHQNTHLYA